MNDNFDNYFITKRELMEIDLKKRAGKCSFLILLFGLCALIFSGLLVVGLRLKAISIEQNEYLKIFMQMAPCIVIDIIIIVVGLKITKLNFKNDIFKKSRYDKKTVVMAMMLCGAVILISSFFNVIYMLITKALGISTPAPDFLFPDKMVLRIFYISYVCILGPLLEEILFRGVILNYLKKYGELTAILFSSILFTMFHLNLLQFMTPLLMGIILAFFAIKFDSIKPSIAIHMFNNTMATIISVTYDMNKYIYMFIILLYIAGGIVSLCFLLYKYIEDIPIMIKEEFKRLSLVKRLKCCFINPTSIIYIIFYFSVIIVNFISENSH